MANRVILKTTIADKQFVRTFIEEQSGEFVTNYFQLCYEDVLRDILVIYTDGSKCEQASYVGSTCYSAERNIQLQDCLPPQGSVFTAEAWAIYNALLLALDLQITKVVVLTDSRSALEAIANTMGRQSNYIITRIRTIVYRLKQSIVDVNFI